MINFRYHVVSITAVIIALAIGIVIGTATVQQGLVDQLRNQLNGVRNDVRNTDSTNDQLRKQLGDWASFAKIAGPSLVSGRLKGVPLLVVAVDGINGDPVSGLVSTLQAAGNYQGTLWLTSKLKLTKSSDVSTLATTLGEPAETNPVTLRQRTYTELAQAWMTKTSSTGTTATSVPEPGSLATTPGGATTTAPGATVAPEPNPCSQAGLLDCLVSAGFVDIDTPPNAAGVTVAAGTRFVAVSGDGAVVPDDQGVSQVVRALITASNSVSVVAAESVRDPNSKDPQARARFLGPLLSAADLAAKVSSDDAIDDFRGQVGTVLALGDLGQGKVGHYGFGPTADRVSPGTGS